MGILSPFKVNHGGAGLIVHPVLFHPLISIRPLNRENSFYCNIKQTRLVNSEGT